MPANTALISIICQDSAGLIADVTGRLYDLGVNLGDTTFAVLGGGAEFTLVGKLPADVDLAEVERELRAVPLTERAADGAALHLSRDPRPIGAHHAPDRAHRR